MHKEPSWRAKAMYIVFAFALVFGLAGVVAMPAPPAAEARIAGEGEFLITGGAYNLTCNELSNMPGYYAMNSTFMGTNVGLETGIDPATGEDKAAYFAKADFTVGVVGGSAAGTHNGSFWAKAYVTDNTGTGSDTIKFCGAYNITGGGCIDDTMISLLGNAVIGPDGALDLQYTSVAQAAGGTWTWEKIGTAGKPEIAPKPPYPQPEAVKDVKGTTQKFVILNVPGGMTSQEFAACGDASIAAKDGNADACLHAAQVLDDQVLKWVMEPGLGTGQGLPEVKDGGGPSFPEDTPRPAENWIKIFKHYRGDAIVRATLDWCGHEITIMAEKKWGDIEYTVLDLKASTEAWDFVNEEPDYTKVDGDCDHPEVVQRDKDEEVQEVVADWVVAEFLESENPTEVFYSRAAHAVVHWWLIKDDALGLNQAYLHNLMDNLGSDGDCSGCGTYAGWPAVPKVIIDDLAFNIIPPGSVPDPWTGTAQYADHTTWKAKYGLQDIHATETYGYNYTMDDIPGEIRGLALAELKNTAEEDVIVVTLVEYPDEYSGENPVCVEMGKKSFVEVILPTPDITKTPQLRWAGEKIVLEQNWAKFFVDGGEYIAVYHKEAQSKGELSPAGQNLAWEKGADDIWVIVNSSDAVSEVLLESEVQGEVDVNVKLYKATRADVYPWLLDGEPIVNYGFLVYYLAFEDLVPRLDLSLPEGLDDLRPVGHPLKIAGDEAQIVVQVRGWFYSDDLPGTTRPEVNLDPSNPTLDMPYGRYVMPDDWPALAGDNYDWNSNWDLMDDAQMDLIVSPADINWPAGTHAEELGAYNNRVITTTDPGEAENPSIGPFNTLQPWTNELIWDASRVVPSSLPGTDRNTVVPDGVLDASDAPMPQALISFQIVADSPATTGTLSKLDKGDLVGYGVDSATKKYQSPFYRVEIPSHTLIPDVDYDWKSWSGELCWPQLGRACPYDYWEDLQKSTMYDGVLDKEIGFGNTDTADVNHRDIEVYSDNHGIAGLTIDPLEQSGAVTITATAVYPAGLKAGKYGPRALSDEITAYWGVREPNPFFAADDTQIEAEETVTFTNLSEGGVTPYKSCTWNFDAPNGLGETVTPEADIKTDMACQLMQTTDWTYMVEGTYWVELCITDLADVTRCEVREAYIVVGPGGEPPTEFHTWSFEYGDQCYPRSLSDTYTGTVDLDALTLVPDCVQGVYYEDGTSWVPDAPGNTLQYIYGGDYNYTVCVNGDCDWIISLP